MNIQEIKNEYLKFCEKKPHDDKYTIDTHDFESLLSIISQLSAEIERLREAIKEAKDKEWELAGETTPVFMILHLALSEVEGESP